MDQSRIERCRDDILPPKGQLLPIGHGDLVRHVFPRQRGKRLGTGDLHLVVDGARVNIQRAPEQIGKAEDVIDLIGIVGPPRGNDGVGSDGTRLFGRDFRIGVRHGKEDRILGHAFDHLGCHRALDTDPQKDVCALHRIRETPVLGFHRVGRLPLVHAFGAALIDHALGVRDDAVFVLCSHPL